MSYCKKKGIEPTVCYCLACEYCLPPSERIGGRMCENEVMNKEKGRMTEVINVKILHLVLKKKWYEMQERGEKTEEYRELTEYWRKRLIDQETLRVKPYTHVCFHYGYTQRCFINRIDSITIGMGLPEWGAPTYREVFIIKHHREPSPFVVGKDFER